MSTAATIPRWEWRCFAPSLTISPKTLLIPADAARHESDEVYILDLTGRISDNVKIRDEVLDVKRLLKTDADGLELWEPILKARFPLGRKDVAAVFAAWMPPASELTRDSYALAELVEDIFATRPALRLVRVHKSRRGFTFSGCLAEVAQIRAETVSMQTLSLEHEDPKRLLAALCSLGLNAHANTNYILGLKRALGLEHTAG
ncbi:MAG TPA: hypothetical protein VMU06_20765 [Stellaceae bacterium]|nr:hypothetical protein [Stellaceae bacterium]